MTLQKKILAGYGIALALLFTVLLWAVLNLEDLGRASEAILRENYKSILAAGNMIGALERQDSAMLLVLLGHPEEGTAQFREHENQFLQWLARARDNITIEGETEIILDIEAAYAQYLAAFSRLLQLEADDPPGAAVSYREVGFPSFQRIRDACARLRGLNQDTMYLASKQADTIAGRAIWSTSLIGAAAVAAGLAFSLLLSRRLVKPLRQLMTTAQRIGEGQYEVQVQPSGTDELDRLAGEFNAMAGKLRAYHHLNVEQLVAEKQKSEAILRSIEDGLVVVDADFAVANINLSAVQLLGLDPGEAIGRPLVEIVENEPLLKYVKKAAQTGRPPRIAEEDNILTVGQGREVRHLLFSITPVHTRSGGMVGIVLLLRDVTRLKEVDQLKSQFVMTASHELKTPLTSIGMGIELLMEGATHRLDEKQNQLLAAAHDEVQRLKALVDDLLDLAKIEAGRIDLEFDRVPVQVLFEKVTAVFAAQAGAQAVEITAEIPPDLPEARADANKITWVLTNLVSNALRYVGRGGHIHLAARRANAQLHLSVRDDGIGIPPEYQAKIFDKFTQVKGDAQSQGTGLGLAICKEIVRAHRGAIWVESAPGEGSTFKFTLPVAE